ncbi:lipid-A-disaccharide synthase [Legionella sp. MW5194]|uniref:lipid-A-disaccharide synthase n=1 Tax=Legionella sp. MW5194 TaxID=2662448 RepID=UPI00193E551B|nr:lipid-A-disaccharide synthase [Legionella sp. MW5194]QRN04959.1 lipid-A-disaccharide synthase [Legionella sp. MW5194]
MGERPIKIAIVAGEPSGDLLGAGLIAALNEGLGNVTFVGIGGAQMQSQGFHSFFPMDYLSVMGITDVLKRYLPLLFLRKRLIRELTMNPPDVFIGIDYAGFNLVVEKKLKKQGIKTIHYVSPKLWAWRQKRVYKVKEAVDLILTLFPFEKTFYQRYGVPVSFVGHPLADMIDPQVDKKRLREQAGYADSDTLVTLLPGSRLGELRYLGPLYLDVMKQLSLKRPDLIFIVPLATSKAMALFEAQWRASGYLHLNIKLQQGGAREAMALANAVLVKSGTGILEAMLLKCNMVVAYKWSALSHLIIAPQLKINYIALPNLLANEALVPEFIQKQAKPEAISQCLLELLAKGDAPARVMEKFERLHQQLKQDANSKAAMAVIKLLQAAPSSA